MIDSSATFEHPDHHTYHRIVIDESHLINSSSIRKKLLPRFRAELRWCVSATPFQGFVEQAEFLKLTKTITSAPESQRLRVLKKRMIRHTKSQSINGAVALQLPEMTTTCKKVPMAALDELRYTQHETNVSSVVACNSSKPAYLFMQVYSLLQSKVFLQEPSPKINALRADLLKMKAEEPNLRVVVFTQFRAMQAQVDKCVQALGIKCYSFSGSTAASKRHRSIKEFQSMEWTGPAAFSITMGSGSVGMTLTAASHVFLLEPCLDPATETQAAGRINRLGQTKTVGVTKYVYEKSFESNIVDMHGQLKSGAIAMTEERAFPKAAMQILGKSHHSASNNSGSVIETASF